MDLRRGFQIRDFSAISLSRIPVPFLNSIGIDVLVRAHSALEWRASHEIAGTLLATRSLNLSEYVPETAIKNERNSSQSGD